MQEGFEYKVVANDPNNPPPPGAPPLVECPVCGHVSRLRRSLGLKAHLRKTSASEWCEGGQPPTNEQRLKAESKVILGYMPSGQGTAAGLPGVGETLVRRHSAEAVRDTYVQTVGRRREAYLALKASPSAGAKRRLESAKEQERMARHHLEDVLLAHDPSFEMTAQTPTVHCAACGGSVRSLRAATGSLRPHLLPDDTLTWCRGGLNPETGESNTRAVKQPQSASQSIQAWRGGLPGLGRRR